MIKKNFLLFILLIVPQFVFSQEVAIERPAIWGIAKMTVMVSDYQVARDYYGRFPGFDGVFYYLSHLGKVISFKVNERQFLELLGDRQAKDKKCLVSLSFSGILVKLGKPFLQK